MKYLVLVIVLTWGVFGNAFAQEKKAITGEIVNGKAIYLPKPDYPQEAKDFCAKGQVEIEVLIGEDGNVIEAKAISGDELLHASAVEAAKKAKFTTGHSAIRVKGIIVYNFDTLAKCIVIGIVNRKAVRLLKPKVANLNSQKHFLIKKAEFVVIQIVIDMSGNVVSSRALLGNPLLRAACEIAARQTKFAPTLANIPPIKIRALIAYKFKPNGTVETEIEKDDKDFIGMPVGLVEPPLPFCNCKFGSNSSVTVTAEIDGQGNVIEATAISGHPILKLASQKAALESKFLPTNIKAEIIIRYNFTQVDKWSVKISSIEIIEVKVIK